MEWGEFPFGRVLIAPVVKYVLELTDMAEFGVKKRSATYDKPLRGRGREGRCLVSTSLEP
jgi:hypothetical protein